MKKQNGCLTAFLIGLGLLGIVAVFLGMALYLVQTKFNVKEVQFVDSSSPVALDTSNGPLAYYFPKTEIQTAKYKLVYISLGMPYGTKPAYPMDIVLLDRQLAEHPAKDDEGEPDDQIRVLPSKVTISNDTVSFAGHDARAGDVSFAGKLGTDGTLHILTGDLTVADQTFHDVSLADKP